MYYKIKDNVFNIDEVLYIYNDYKGINIMFNNGSKLTINYNIINEDKEKREDYKNLCNKLINKGVK